jgi:hypothetical protein
MKKNLLLIILIMGSFSENWAQYFEGKITYSTQYKSKIPNVSDTQLTTMMGAQQEYYFKNGNYVSLTNGAAVLGQYYILKDNKLYTKMANIEAYLWNDATENADVVLSAVVNKNVAKILDFDCDELILTCQSGVQKYYFSEKIAVNAEWFTQHKFGNWAEFISRSKALPLKMVVDSPQFTLESTATSVQKQVLESSFFSLPPGAQTMKNPY